MKDNRKKIYFKETLIALAIILCSITTNFILHRSLPIKESPSISSHNIKLESDQELLKTIEGNPKKMILVNLLTIGFIVFFIFGIINLFLISRSIRQKNKNSKAIRTHSFSKTMPLNKALLCISSVFLWYTVSKESQIISSLFSQKISFTYLLILTFFIQLISILSIIDLSPLQLIRLRPKFLRQIPKIFYFYLALIPATLLMSSISGAIANHLGLPLEPMPLIGIMANGKISTFAYILIGIEAIIFAPIFEELLFRGVIFGFLRKKFSFAFSATVSGIIFSIMHEHYLSFLPILVLAITFSYLYERTKNLAYPILLHAIYNGMSILSVTILKDIIN